MNGGRGGYYTTTHAMNGVGDIVGCLPDGRFLSCEVKTKTGRPSADQMLFIKRCKRNNGVCFIARSIDDVQKNLHEAGLSLD